MRALIRRSWFAAAVFAGATMGCALLLGQKPGGSLRSAAAAFLVMPPLWWWLVVRRTHARAGRGAAAGAIGAVLIWLMSLIAVELWVEVPKSHRDAFGEWTGGMLFIFAGLVGIPVSAVLGALLGAPTAYAQNRWWGPGPQGKRRDSGDARD